MALNLKITAPDGRKQAHKLGKGSYTIGRDAANDIVLESEEDAPPTSLFLEVSDKAVNLINQSGADIPLSDGQTLLAGSALRFSLPLNIKLNLGQFRLHLRTTRQYVAEKGLKFDGDIDLGEKEEEATTGTLSGEDAPSERTAERVVSTGFAETATAATPADKMRPLQAGQRYLFWLEVGAPVAGSIETERVTLDIDKLPPEAELKVALFAFDGELEITRGQDIGTLRILPSGAVRVANPVDIPDGVAADLLKRRLFFPVRTPATPGVHRLRCNIYYEQVLLQSRMVEASVTADATPAAAAEPVLRATADYIISKTLDPAYLAKMPRHRLSLMLNSNGNGTHGFRFFGEGEFKNDASFDGQELQNLINNTRGALRKAAWDDEEPYDVSKNLAYRYAGPLNLKQLRIDLIRCAIRGYRFYDTLINRLAGDADAAFDLADLMLKPGQVQIASKESARLIVPAALFYDYPLYTNLNASEFQICPEFEAAVQGSAPLEASRCFQGDCPSHGQDNVVCPSGFWGFRHELGFPVTVATAPDAPVEIKYDGTPEFTVGVSTDPNFVGRSEHEKTLKSIKTGTEWNYADSQDATFKLLKDTSPDIVYFFCHGGVVKDVPYIQVGGTDSRGISSDNLRAKRIRWREKRPLVFINGCHTTALEPEVAINLVAGFIETSHAAGVIGTEITIFVPLARAFAEEFFRRFVVEEQSVGAAVRGARLHLLKQGNPLGLVYIPYAMTGLRLAR